MADTVDLKNITEYEETGELLAGKIDQLAELWRAAQTVVFFTGAGISTSAKIPDFRGPDGCWTAAALGKAAPKGVALAQALPTACHMAILSLMRDGDKSCYCVSQNIDGLHRRSGMTADEISELHGNTFLELCWSCGAEYLRPHEVHGGARGRSCAECRTRVPHFCHCTVRQCRCGAQLKDSIIHFKENLPVKALQRAFDWAERADLCIVLGSSCTVAPACLVPKTVASRGGKLVVVNLQKTPLDGLAALRIFARTDELMTALLQRLHVEPLRFDLASDPVLHQSAGHGDAASAAVAPLPGHDLLSSTTTTTPPLPTPAADGPLSADTDTGGYVVPRRDCPHVPSALGQLTLEAARKLVSGGCGQCGEQKEAWLCVSCLGLNCGRYVNGHAVAHSAAAEHPVAISLTDLNTWCYACESYLLSDALDPLHVLLHVAKFGTLPPGCSASLKSP